MNWFGRTSRRVASVGRPVRSRRASAPRLTPLEDRALTTITGVWGRLAPQVLPPSNSGRYLPIRITGEVTNSRPNQIPKATYQVIDQYRTVEPAGTIRLTRIKPGDYVFDFTIKLQATRSPHFASARLYSVTLGFEDADNGAGKTLPVIVPNLNDVAPRPGPKGAARPGRR